LIHKIVPSINLAYKSTNKNEKLCKQLFAKKRKKNFTQSTNKITLTEQTLFNAKAA